MAAIAVHLATVGKDWEPLRAKFPEVSRATFFRLVARVRGAPPAKRVLPGAVRKAKALANAHLPAPVSPDYLAKGGSKAVANIDFLTRFEGLWRDAEMLRAWATKTTGEGADAVESVKVPMIFADSVRLRQGTLESMLKAMAEVYDLERQQSFYNAILAAIQQVSPEVARRVLVELERLNRERGMTSAALG